LRHTQTKILIENQVGVVIVIEFDDPVVKNQGAFPMSGLARQRAFGQKFGKATRHA